jgi:hypothetical protein
VLCGFLTLLILWFFGISFANCTVDGFHQSPKSLYERSQAGNVRRHDAKLGWIRDRASTVCQQIALSLVSFVLSTHYFPAVLL